MAPRDGVILWGTPAFAVPALKLLIEKNLLKAVVTKEPKRQGRGLKKILSSPVDEEAKKAGIPVLTPTRLIDPDFRSNLAQWLPATFLVIAYGKIIPDDILALSTMPAINIHPSLLPELRGPSPIQTAILLGHTQTGLTLMQLDNEVDHGPILAQKKITLSPTDTATTLTEKLSFSCPQFLEKYLPAYLAGALAPAPQDHARATFTKKITASDGLLNPAEQTTDEALRHIRAFNPWPGTYISLGQRRLSIASAAVLPVSTPSTNPGTLFETPNKMLGIQFSDGAIEALQVQREGGTLMNSRDFLRGHRTILGR